MRTLETNDWMILSNIIYQMNATKDSKKMRENFLVQMKLILDFDSADFYIVTDKNSHNLTEPVYYNYTAKPGENYMDKYDGIDYSRGLMFGGKSKVYRESDILPDEKRIKTEYYKSYFEPNGWFHALNMILARNNQFLGVVTFFREKRHKDYDYEDFFLLDMLKEHMALRLYQDFEKHLEGHEKLTVSECALKFHLTKREETILHYLIRGEDNETTCQDLCITNNTLKKHILNLYKKLGINNRVQMFKMILDNE